MCHTLDHYEAQCGRTTEGERGREREREGGKEGEEKTVRVKGRAVNVWTYVQLGCQLSLLNGVGFGGIM